MLPALPCDIDERYTIVAELGHGSHAIVYRAVDRMLDREVAIKVLRSELVDSDVSERFRREIRLTSQLEHPHIAHVYGTGEFLGTPYFVTELARGASLAERLAREKPLPVNEALSIVRDIASALGHAHRAGIIHRDVKPANILLTPQGALLTDFGVARALEHSPGTLATSTGVAVGTLLYMSPEQLCAEKGIDARSDQYALALVLYEMLAGVSAHVAANAEGLRALRVAGQHVSLRTLRASVPESVDAAMDRALSSTPADRFRDVPTFVSALDGVGDSTGSRRSSGTHSTVSAAGWPLRRRWLLAGGLASLVAAVGAYGAIKVRRDELAAGPSAGGANGYSFTLQAVGDTSLSAPVVRALSAELGEWPDVRAEVSQRRGATRSLETRASLMGGALQVTVLVPSGTTSPRAVRIRFPDARSLDADSLKLVAARVLFASVVSPDSAETLNAVTLRSTASVQAYARGWLAVLAGELATAENVFADATRTTAVPQAALWQATIASWRQPMRPSTWREPSRLATDRAGLLIARDSLLALALLMRSVDSMPAACDAYSRATRVDGASFAAWYGFGECLRIDSTVVRDARSPTGSRFRTSQWGAIHAYELAMERLPSGKLCALFDRLQHGPIAIGATLRRGLLDGRAGAPYSGVRSLSGDSVVVLPMRSDLFASGANGALPASYQAAMRRNRRRLLQAAATLAARTPSSVVAQLAYAYALEHAGVFTSVGAEPAALSVLTKARSLLRTSHDSVELLLTELRVRLRLEDFSGARTVGLQLLDLSRSAVLSDAVRLAPVALLLSRTPAAESLIARRLAVSTGGDDDLPASLSRSAARYRIASALNDCGEVVRRRTELVLMLRNHYSPAEMASALERHVVPVDWSQLGCSEIPLPLRVGQSDPVLEAYAALREGRKDRAAQFVRSTDAGRSGAARSSIAWDTQFAEISLLLQSDDVELARTRIEGAFSDLAATMDFVLVAPEQTAGFRRTMDLCLQIPWTSHSAGVRSRCDAAVRALDGAP